MGTTMVRTKPHWVSVAASAVGGGGGDYQVYINTCF